MYIRTHQNLPFCTGTDFTFRCLQIFLLNNLTKNIYFLFFAFFQAQLSPWRLPAVPPAMWPAAGQLPARLPSSLSRPGGGAGGGAGPPRGSLGAAGTQLRDQTAALSALWGAGAGGLSGETWGGQLALSRGQACLVWPTLRQVIRVAV